MLYKIYVGTCRVIRRLPILIHNYARKFIMNLKNG